MSLSDALEHEPVKPTYAIRIYSSIPSNQQDKSSFYKSLKNSNFYKKIAEYTFDDNDRYIKVGDVTITPEIADDIVTDFAEYKDQVESLLVHCSRGKNRSPSVAFALSEIFNLGHDTERLKKEYFFHNKLVYEKVLEAGKGKGLI